MTIAVVYPSCIMIEGLVRPLSWLDPMLVLSRKVGQRILIGDQIVVIFHVVRVNCRAEQLDVETILAFCEAIRAVVGDELIL